MTTRSMPNLGFVPLAAVLLLGGCASVLDPHNRDGAWRPTGANEFNLRAMVARPSDLAQGLGEPGAEGQTAAQAIDRMRNDRVRALPDTSVALRQVSGTGAGSQ